MSLVLEALRRVEKSDLKAGSVGVAVAAHRPARRRRGTLIPLLLGLGTGVMLFLFGRPALEPVSRNAPGNGVAADEARQAPLAKARAALPPMRLGEPVVQPLDIRPPADSSAPRGEPGQGGSRLGLNAERQESSPRTGRTAAVLEIGTSRLVLQAISERDSHPIAIINDQLVREGDLLGRARVLRIGPESVDVLLENGKKETVRFGPPPPPEPTPSPDPL